MSAADIGSQFDNYTGNAGLGGGYVDAIKIDTKPLEDLSRYTFLYNKAESERKDELAKANSKELADNTSYDLTTAIPKDRKVVEDAYNAFIDWTKQNASKLTPAEANSPIMLDYRERKNKLSDLLRYAKTRNVIYKARQLDIANKPPAIAGELQRSLDEEASATDITTPLKPSQDFDLAPVEIKAAPAISIDVVRQGDNQIAIRDYKLPDYKSARSWAIATAGGLIDSFPREGTPEYNSLSQETRNNIQQQRKLQIMSGKLQPVKEAEVLTSIINKTDETGKKVYFKPDGTLDQEALLKGESGNGLFMRILQQVNAYNNGVKKITNSINSGEFMDKAGKKLAFGFGLDEADFQPIDLGKGSISPEEVLMMQSIGKSQDINYSTKIQETNESINIGKLAVDQTNAEENIRHDKAGEATARMNAETQRKQVEGEVEKWRASQTGQDEEKNGAMLRAKRIYNSLTKLANGGGVISPDKVRQLNTEQLKYLGSEQVVQGSNGENKTVFQPLVLDPKKSYAIQVENGDIKVMEGDENAIRQMPDGRYAGGKWVSNKSTNLFNVATNVLNEELRTAGSKELNAYMPLDQGVVGTSTETSGGSSSASGSSSTTKSSSVPSYSRQELKDKYGYKDSEIDQAVAMGNIKLK